MLHFRAETLELIARGEPLAIVGDFICRSIERAFPDIICTLLTVDGGGMLHPLSAPSLPADYSRSIDNVSVGPSAGSCGTAAYTGYPVEVHDIASDPRWLDYKEIPLSLGLSACWSTPLKGSSGLVVATFALYFRERRGPTAAEREMVQICLHLCDLALARNTRVEDRERRANIDALTGLPNRGSFEHTLTHLGCAQPGSWALFILDLDNLKTTNDTFGHSAGDRLLQDVASRLGETLLPDRVFRIGGDEFAILIMAPDRLKDLEGTAATILQALLPPIEFTSFSILPTATIGGALVRGVEISPATVHRDADVALYHAKETQPGGFVRFEPGMGARITARLSSIEMLERALEEDRVDAWYQPIVDIRTERVVGLEALCRIVGANGGSLPGGVLQAATADARTAAMLTRRILSRVADDMHGWHQVGIPPCPISVNISAADLLGGQLQSVLDTTFGQDTELLNFLVLETTESICLGRQSETMSGVLGALRGRGIRISLDDFGTGYASLTHLLSLPIDIIKIDQAFTSRLLGDGLARAIISAVIAIAGELGAQVIAEGIEDADQVTELHALGCDACQGFLYSPAVPRAEAAILLMRHLQHSTLGIPMPKSSMITRPAPIAGSPGKINKSVTGWTGYKDSELSALG